MSLAAARVANALDNKAVTADTKAMFAGYLISQLGQLLRLKVRAFSTLHAVKVIVLGIPVVVLVHTAAIQLEATQQARIHKFF